MKNFSELYAQLRRKNGKQYALLAACIFFSVLLMTAYVSMMRSPSILAVLPEGGDSRKQVMMVFVLAVIGCGMFTTYAAGLFFRQKSRQTGVLLALGASRQQLKREQRRELALLALAACAAGAVLGGPLAWAVWQGFRLLLVDSREMALAFDPESYLLTLAFSAYVVGMLFIMGSRSLGRVNIIDIVQESHKSEPIREVKPWYGPVGLALLATGGLLGYLMPSFFVRQLQWYSPPIVDGLFYLPALVGLYMILLHTVVNGWRRRHPYQDIIATSMMKFQGRQTVRNMLVMTLLIAGAYFASFYAPMMSTSAALNSGSWPVDYVYHWRTDQNIPQQPEVEALARQYGVSLTSWAQQDAARLGVDGLEQMETDQGMLGTTYKREYRKLLLSKVFLSESAYAALTGRPTDLAPGTCAGIVDDEGGSRYMAGDVTHLTNTLTGAELDVEPVEPLRYSLLMGCYVLDDGDYAVLAAGLTETWRETWVFFNVENVDKTYPFAKALFNEIVDRSGPEVALCEYWDPVERQLEIQRQGSYNYDDPAYLQEHDLTIIRYDQRDSSEFRNGWTYMPRFRVLDRNDFVTTMAVFLMLFVFIALICFAAVFVIAYTRCMTIALANRQVYEDLARLGAPGSYLRRSVRGQVSRVFLVPTLVGTGLISVFYTLIMYANGTPLGFTAGELAGMGACLGVIAGVSALLYAVYRLTLQRVCRTLQIA
ncbi:MAG: ABC transporter permease [Eubacteriales bacterium]|nr:ABC transporter permease [Eubacteriales bacterium]